LKRYLLAHPKTERDLHRIVIVPCQVGPRQVWNGYEEIDCSQLLQGDAMPGRLVDSQ
jgi:hypothetical protein